MSVEDQMVLAEKERVASLNPASQHVPRSITHRSFEAGGVWRTIHIVHNNTFAAQVGLGEQCPKGVWCYPQLQSLCFKSSLN